jgi:hypothetical protein
VKYVVSDTIRRKVRCRADGIMCYRVELLANGAPSGSLPAVRHEL